MPAAALQQALTRQFFFEPVDPVPGRSVTFDGQAGVCTFHYQVDGMFIDGEFGSDPESAGSQLQKNIDLEPAFEGVRQGTLFPVGSRGQPAQLFHIEVFRFGQRHFRIFKILQQAVAQAAGIEFFRLDRVEQPYLVAGPADRHIEAAFVSRAGQHPDAAIRRFHHAQEHHIPFVPLEGVRISADQIAFLDLFFSQQIDQQFFNIAGLSGALQTDHSEGFAVIIRILATVFDLAGQGFRLQGIDQLSSVILGEGLVDVFRSDHRLQAGVPELAEGNQRFGLITEAVGEFDNFRHAAEMLPQPDRMAEAHLRLVEEAVIHPDDVVMGNIAEVFLAQPIDIFPADPDIIRADLVVVANHHDLLGDVHQKQRFRAGLAGFVNDCHIEHLRQGTDCFRHPVDRHDPGRDDAAAFLQMLLGRLAMLVDIFALTLADPLHRLGPGQQVLAFVFGHARKTMIPGFHGGQLGKQFADHLLGGLIFQLQALLVLLAASAFQPGLGAGPIPGGAEADHLFVPLAVVVAQEDCFQQLGGGIHQFIEQHVAAVEVFPQLIEGMQVFQLRVILLLVAIAHRLQQPLQNRMGLLLEGQLQQFFLHLIEGMLGLHHVSFYIICDQHGAGVTDRFDVMPVRLEDLRIFCSDLAQFHGALVQFQRPGQRFIKAFVLRQLNAQRGLAGNVGVLRPVLGQGVETVGHFDIIQQGLQIAHGIAGAAVDQHQLHQVERLAHHPGAEGADADPAFVKQMLVKAAGMFLDGAEISPFQTGNADFADRIDMRFQVRDVLFSEPVEGLPDGDPPRQDV